MYPWVARSLPVGPWRCHSCNTPCITISIVTFLSYCITKRWLNVKKILAVINATYAVALIVARIFFTFISSLCSSNIWISYIHNFIFIFPGYITNQFNDQLPIGSIAQLVRALHRYRRGQGSNPGKPDFFRLSFRNCISCVNNCEDLLYIYFFILQVKYMDFIIYS